MLHTKTILGQSSFSFKQPTFLFFKCDAMKFFKTPKPLSPPPLNLPFEKSVTFRSKATASQTFLEHLNIWTDNSGIDNWIQVKKVSTQIMNFRPILWTSFNFVNIVSLSLWVSLWVSSILFHSKFEVRTNFMVNIAWPLIYGCTSSLYTSSVDKVFDMTFC